MLSEDLETGIARRAREEYWGGESSQKTRKRKPRTQGLFLRTLASIRFQEEADKENPIVGKSGKKKEEHPTPPKTQNLCTFRKKGERRSSVLG